MDKPRLDVTRPAVPSQRDWEAVMRQLRNVLQQICENELVSSDERCQQIIGDMIGADMPHIDAQMRLLALRVGELLAAKTGDETMMARLAAQPPARQSVTHHRSDRTFLKL